MHFYIHYNVECVDVDDDDDGDDDYEWSSTNLLKQYEQRKKIQRAKYNNYRIEHSDRNMTIAKKCDMTWFECMQHLYFDPYEIRSKIFDNKEYRTHIAIKFKPQRLFKCNTWQIVPYFVTLKRIKNIYNKLSFSYLLLGKIFFCHFLKKPIFSHTSVRYRLDSSDFSLNSNGSD